MLRLPGLYSSAVACVYPSEYEGFGLPVLEAMQCGTAVITSQDPAVMEVSGGAAIHVDTAGLFGAMETLLRNPEERVRRRELSLRACGGIFLGEQPRAKHTKCTRKPVGVFMADALILCPEAPYPVAGGGPLRTACMVEYLASRYELDVIAFREPGAPDPRAAFPLGLFRNFAVIDLPYHSKQPHARVLRNVRRLLRNTPPLVDRFAGFDLQIRGKYDVAVIEHFWCAPYVDRLRRALRSHRAESAQRRVRPARALCSDRVGHGRRGTPAVRSGLRSSRA